MSDSNAVIRFAIKTYFSGDIAEAAEITGYTQTQLRRWSTDEVSARADTARYIMAVALIPEFQVVCEHKPFDENEAVASQVHGMLHGHHDQPGVYAFYDSFCRLIYIGKANSSLKSEIIDALGRTVDVPFPRSAARPAKRKSVVKFISAYDVGGKDHSDYPKHVESLILRISKPALNKQSGSLTKVLPKKPRA